MVNNKLFLIFLMSIVFTALASAVPPITSLQTSGLDISSGVSSPIMVNTSANFSFHVFNATSGKVIHSGISCMLHIYYDAVGIQWEGFNDTANINYEYIFSIPKSSFNQTGNYFYTAFCNSTTIGGFVTDNLHVTPAGLELTQEKSRMNSIALIFMFLFFLMSVTGFIITPWRDVKNEDGVIVGINDLKWLKLILGFLSYLLLLIIVNMLYEYTNAYSDLVSFKAYFSVFHTLLIYLLWPIMLITIVSIIWSIVYNQRLSKELEQGLTQ